MKVINPDEQINSINFIPRDYGFNTLTLELYDETARDRIANTEAFILANGYVTIDFDILDYAPIELYENGTYQIKITNENESVIYRGKAIATTQITQDYKLTNYE